MLLVKTSALTLAHAPQCSVNPRKLGLRVMDLTAVIRHAIWMRLRPRVQLILAVLADSRPIVLHAYEIASTEHRLRFLSLAIEKRVLETPRSAKDPALRVP